jgi:hypothetical protein
MHKGTYMPKNYNHTRRPIIRRRTKAAYLLLVVSSMAFYSLSDAGGDQATSKRAKTEDALPTCINQTTHKIKLPTYRDGNCSIDAMP